MIVNIRVGGSKLESILSPYRVLDFSDEKGFLCGKIMGDLGLDVIKIEKPGGDPSRNIGPFFNDDLHPEKSLYWLAFNQNKRSITLNFETVDGQDILWKLIRDTDFLIESFPVGYMNKVGLGYTDLSSINPRLIYVSISPFGQEGPYKDYKAYDLEVMAMAGFLNLCGDADRPPVQISTLHQAYLLACVDGVIAALEALRFRRRKGSGQHIDVSAHQSAIPPTLNAIPLWESQGIILRRNGLYRVGLSSGAVQRQTWQCKDGYVTLTIYGGRIGERTNRPLVEWMDEEGFANDYLRAMNWESLDMSSISQEEMDMIQKPIMKFFASHRKAELFKGAQKRSIMIYPVYTTKDLLEDSQLKARDFWSKVSHSEFKSSILYPGPFVRMSESPIKSSAKAPLIGEHNEQIYQDELGFSKEEVCVLKQAGII